MSENLIIKHCAPTLAGLKTGNLFTAAYETKEQLDKEIAHLNERLACRGIRVVRLRARMGRALIYIYRPAKLAGDLDRREAREILAQFGYTEAGKTTECINRLSQRICSCSDFPHEIGLFLGYPTEDVKGFIERGGQDCKACGYWKVYGDVSAAEEMFRKYEKCTCVYLKCLEQGRPFEKLAVRKAKIRS